MGYQVGHGQSGSDDVTLHSGAITATTTGDPIDIRRGTLRLTLDVTVVAGTNPTLDVELQTRRDSDDTWRAVASFAQSTGVDAERAVFPGIDRQVRLVSTVGGTGSPSFTFSVSGDAV